MEITRPNGKLYRARKGSAWIMFDGSDSDDGNCSVLILRTDDYEYAKRLAHGLLEDHDRECAASMNDGTFGWWRETIRDNQRYWGWDSGRGMPGWWFESK